MDLCFAAIPTSSACPGKGVFPRVRRRSLCAEGATMKKDGWPQAMGEVWWGWLSPRVTVAEIGVRHKELTSTYEATTVRWALILFAFSVVTSSTLLEPPPWPQTLVQFLRLGGSETWYCEFCLFCAAKKDIKVGTVHSVLPFTSKPLVPSFHFPLSS